MLGGEIDDLAVASRLIQTTPFQPVYAEDRISNVGGIRFYLESVMHALGEQRERPGTSPVLEATLQDYIPKLTAEFRKLAAKNLATRRFKDEGAPEGGQSATVVSIAIDAGERHRFACRLGISNRATGNWFRVLIGESKTAAEGRPWL